MALHKIASVSVFSAEGHEISVRGSTGGVEFGLGDINVNFTLTAEDLREIVREFAKKPREPRGPRKPRATSANGESGEKRSKVAAVA